MRKVVSGLFISLDGVVESPDKWSFDHFDEGMADLLQTMQDAADAVMMGRVTYEEWASYWPTSTDEPFATWINSIPKYVVSTTLDRADWQNSMLVRNVTDTIAQLKQQPGKNINVTGSPTLVRSLFENDLLDELVLTVHPVVAGRGKRLFIEGMNLKRLTLVENKTTPTGVAILTYHPRGE